MTIITVIKSYAMFFLSVSIGITISETVFWITKNDGYIIDFVKKYKAL